VHTAPRTGTVEADALVSGGTVRVTPEDALVMPGLKVSLVFVPTVTSRGLSVIFESTRVNIRKGGRVVMKGVSLGDVCVVAVPEGGGGGDVLVHAALVASFWHR